MLYVAIRQPMTNCQDDDLMSLAYDLLKTNSCVVDTDDFEVNANSPTGMSVLVGSADTATIPDRAYVYCSSLLTQMRISLDAITQLTIDANSSGSTRIDSICIKVDTTVTADADADNVASLVVVKGTPGAGNPTIPANHQELARITVANGASVITATEIEDVRTLLGNYVPTADSTTTLTNKTLTSPLFKGNVDGWISANETWTYASATTINSQI